MEPQCFVDTACKAAALDAARDIIDLGSTFGGVVTYPLWWLLNASSDHPETPSVDEPGEGSGSRNWRQDKLLSPGEIEALQEALRKEGMTIHDLKHEPRRVIRRLQPLRGWSHDQFNQVPA